MSPRKYEPREMKLVSEYLVDRYGKYRSLTRVRLGALHPSLLPEKLSQAEKDMIKINKNEINDFAECVIPLDRVYDLVNCTLARLSC